MSKCKVLHVVLNLEAGGLERVVADLIRSTDSSRFEQHLLVLEYFGRNAAGLDSFATLHQSPELPRWTVIWPAPLTRLIKSISPDVVHTHSGVWNKVTLAARRAGVPLLVHTEHGRGKWPEPWIDRFVDRLAAARTDVVVSVSDAAADQIGGTIVRDRRKLTVVRNGIDTSVYAAGAPDPDVRKELSINASAPVIGSVGRFDPIKGYDVVLEAFSLLLRGSRGPLPTLVLVGDGPERLALETQAKRLGVMCQVRFTGWRADTVRMLRAFSIFTMGSRSEGTSISLLEAMSVGICPVVTNVGGNPSVLGDSLAHRLVPSERADLLAGAWDDALSDRAAVERDGRLSRAQVLNEYSLSGMVRAYEAIYLEGRPH